MKTSSVRKSGTRKSTFVAVMKAFTIIYALVGLFFFIFHAFLEQRLGMSQAPNRFWIVLTLSMMFMLSFLSWQSSRRPGEKAFVQCHLLSKATSVSGFLVAYAADPSVWGHLVGAGTDAAVFATVAFFYTRAKTDL